MPRKAGIPNRSTLMQEQKAKELGVDPFAILLLIAKGDWEALGMAKTRLRFTKSGESYESESITVEHRIEAASKACEYLYPKRKAIEVEISRAPGRPLKDLTDEELDQL